MKALKAELRMMSTAQVEIFITACVDLELLVESAGSYTSNSLQTRMTPLDNRAKQCSEAAKEKWRRDAARKAAIDAEQTQEIQPEPEPQPEKQAVIPVEIPDIPKTATESEEILKYWNTKNIIKHTVIDKIRFAAAMKKCKKLYGIAGIRQAIDHYATILHSDKYRWDHHWTLLEFMTRANGISVFYPDTVLKNYLYNGNGNNQQVYKEPIKDKLF